MIVRLEHPAEAQAWCAAARARGASLGFVPTMGALHEGHLALVRRALGENDLACASVFVNPLQFGEASDFELYPRDFGQDVRLLDEVGAAMAFTGTLESFFPRDALPRGGVRSGALRDPGPGALGLEGDLRPGHFAGVATIVARLFDLVRPDRAYFGRKDFQQTLVVKDLARALGYPEVVVCPTVREPSGLALSSRNERLSASERGTALALVRSLEAAREAWRAGERRASALSTAMVAVLARAPVQVEYATVRDPLRWTRDAPAEPLSRAIALVAARVGSVRLIDNMELDG